MADDSSGQKDPQDNISLSGALLAPLNSIFEAQIHSARSFLNFLLKMGFRHTPTQEDIEELEKSDDPADKEQLKHIHSFNKGKSTARKKMQELFRKRINLEANNQSLSSGEVAELKKLNAEYGDLFQQSIDYIDDSGNEITVNIPNLALLPIKPMAIHEAEFSYEFHVAESKKWATKDDGEKKRPWFLIQEPTSLRGGFVQGEHRDSGSTIKVNMKIGTTEMPFGLEKLMVHLTNSIEAIDTPDDGVKQDVSDKET